jgi:hypothetical protein
MGRIKRAIQEIQDKGWPVTNESLTRLFKEKQKKLLEEQKKKENET